MPTTRPIGACASFPLARQSTMARDTTSDRFGRCLPDGHQSESTATIACCRPIPICAPTRCWLLMDLSVTSPRFFPAIIMSPFRLPRRIRYGRQPWSSVRFCADFSDWKPTRKTIGLCWPLMRLPTGLHLPFAMCTWDLSAQIFNIARPPIALCSRSSARVLVIASSSSRRPSVCARR